MYKTIPSEFQVIELDTIREGILDRYEQEIYEDYCDMYPEEIHSDWYLREDADLDQLDNIIDEYAERFFIEVIMKGGKTDGDIH